MKNTKIRKLILVVTLIAVVLCAVVLSGCENKKKSEGKHVKYDITYYLSSIDLWGKTFTGLLDQKKTYLKLTKDGELEMKIIFKPMTISLANVALAAMANGTEDILDLSSADVYVSSIFPTESIKDMKKTLERMTKDLGLTIEGIDYESDEIINLFKSLSEKGTVPVGTKIPEKLAFTLKGRYELKEIKSKTQEEPFRAVYLGENQYPENGETYVILTQFIDDKGLESIRIRNELLSLDAIATVPQPEISQKN